jgi:tetratricopeptide (TPR) repeat protein
LLLKLLAKQNKFEDAIEHAKEAIPLAEQSGDRLTLARAYGGLAEIYQGWGHYGPDLRYIEAAIRFASDTGELLQLGHFLQLAAMHAAGVGETERTKSLLERARPIAKASNDPLLVCQLLKAESLLHTFSRDFEKALEISLEAAEKAHENDLLELEIICLHNAGDAHLRLGRPREALYYFNESVRRSKAARFDRLTQTNEIYIGYVEAAHMGDIEGLDRLKAAIEKARHDRRIWNLQEGNQLVGRILLAWGDRAGAVQYFEEAAEHAKDSGIAFFIEEATYWLSQARGVDIEVSE